MVDYGIVIIYAGRFGKPATYDTTNCHVLGVLGDPEPLRGPICRLGSTAYIVTCGRRDLRCARLRLGVRYVIHRVDS